MVFSSYCTWLVKVLCVSEMEFHTKWNAAQQSFHKVLKQHVRLWIRSGFTIWLTHSTKQPNTAKRSPCWDVNQRNPSLLQNPKDHSRIHKGPPSVSILNQTNPFVALQPCFTYNHINAVFLKLWSGDHRWFIAIRQAVFGGQQSVSEEKELQK
jgi:hypothetical protein